jgi:membrane carboxypeptidase/penicillin-binding protein
MNFLKVIFQWIFSHKKLVFIYIPVLLAALTLTYVLFIYAGWQGDRDSALKRLARYKQLIDKTEELRKGYVYSYSDIDLKAKVVDIPTRIYDRNNSIIGEFFEQKREIIPYSNIPEWIAKGVIASEDRDFANHSGISYKGIIRAFFVNLINFGVVQGGSTITQQLAKVLFTDMKRSIRRKVYEAFCAHEIEKLYDKQDILSMYLNLIYFGNGAYGVESASKMFFGLSVTRLNIVECAVIVATISSPRLYSPLSNLNNSVRKTKRILTSLADAGFINEKKAMYQYDRFLKKWDVRFDEEKKAVSSQIGSFVYSSYRVNRAPFFNEMIRRVLVEKFGEEVVKKGGLRVYTTIDADKQDAALASLRDGIRQQREYHIRRSKKIRSAKRSEAEREKSENIEGALVSLNPGTGEIIAYVGGAEFSAENQNDHVSQIRRQPGSSIKPLIYTAAIQNRDITPATIFVDEKTRFRGGYSPGNYSKKFEGKMTVREALRKSVNVVAVKVLEKTGYSLVFDYLKKILNFSGSEMSKRFRRTLSFALGTYEISPLENAVIHSLLVNGGEFIQPYGIRIVRDYSGNIAWDNESGIRKNIHEKRSEIGKILDPAAASVTISILKNPSYYAVKARKLKFEVAAKTGTSTNHNDAWCVGYTSDMVTAVWIGNKRGAISLGSGRGGSALAVPVWSRYISGIYRNEKPPPFSYSEEELTTETICLDSGEVAGRNGECPRTAVDQLFLTGSEPGVFCSIHVTGKEKEKEKTVISNHLGQE